MSKKGKEIWLCGNHAVEAAVVAGRRKIGEIVVQKGRKMEEKLANIFRSYGCVVNEVEKRFFEDKFAGRPHQGIAARVGELPQVFVEDLLDEDCLMLLDQVTDPHNLGAVLRSCDAFGCGGVVVPERNGAPMSDVVAKAASGALETVPVAQVKNLNQAIKQLQDNGFWLVGLDGAADKTLAELDLKGSKIAFVMGSEGSGMRRLVSENCDFLAKLPMCGTVESLNVSVAAAIALYELRRA